AYRERGVIPVTGSIVSFRPGPARLSRGGRPAFPKPSVLSIYRAASCLASPKRARSLRSRTYGGDEVRPMTPAWMPGDPEDDELEQLFAAGREAWRGSQDDAEQAWRGGEHLADWPEASAGPEYWRYKRAEPRAAGPATRARARGRCRHAVWSRPIRAAAPAQRACRISTRHRWRASGRRRAAAGRPRAGSCRRAGVRCSAAGWHRCPRLGR